MLAGRCTVLVSEKVGVIVCFLIGLICPWVNSVRNSFAHALRYDRYAVERARTLTA